MRAGQTILEIVFIMPLMLLMLGASIDMGRYAYVGILVGSAARAGAAYGGKRPGDTTGIMNAACADYLNNLGPNAACGSSGSTSKDYLNVTSSTSCGCDNGGAITAYGGACDDVPNSLPTDPIPACQSGGGTWTSSVTVTAAGTFGLIFNWPGIPTTITITRTATMRATP